MKSMHAQGNKFLSIDLQSFLVLFSFFFYNSVVITHVAVTGRNQTLFLSIFDHFFDVHVFVTMS